MELEFLILAIAIIVLGYIFFLKPFVENYTAGTYVITWQKPTNTGGDPNCCSYDWQLCENTDSECNSPVDSGTVSGLTASTNKAIWGKSYIIRVRSINAAGHGPWASVNVKAGGGSLTSVTFGQSIKPDGSVSIPLAAGSPQVEIWVGTKVAPISGLQGELILTQTRNGNVVQTYKTKMTYGDLAGNGMGAFLVTIQNVNVVTNDVFNAVINVTDAKAEIWADAEGSITIKEGVPGMVSGISWSYQPSGTNTNACSSSTECPGDDICVTGACVAQKILLVQTFNVSADGKTGGPTGWYLAWSGQPGKVYAYTIQSVKGSSLKQAGTAAVENTPMGWFGSALVAGQISPSEDYEVTITPVGDATGKTVKDTISQPNPVRFIFPLVRRNGVPAYVQTEGPNHVIISGGSNIPPQNAEIFVSTNLKMYYPMGRVATDCPVCFPGYVGYSGGADTAEAMQNGKAIGVAINLFSSRNVVSNLEYQYVINDL